jgi:putative endonuclease
LNYYVYILHCSDDTFYTGISSDIEKRVKEHNGSPKGAKYTRSRRPVKLVYSEVCATKGDALKREIAIKNLSRQQKERLIAEAV